MTNPSDALRLTEEEEKKIEKKSKEAVINGIYLTQDAMLSKFRAYLDGAEVPGEKEIYKNAMVNCKNTGELFSEESAKISAYAFDNYVLGSQWMRDQCAAAVRKKEEEIEFMKQKELWLIKELKEKHGIEISEKTLNNYSRTK